MKSSSMAKAWVCAAAVAVVAGFGTAAGAGVALPWEASGETLAEFWAPGDEWVLEVDGTPEGVEYQVALLDRMTNGVGSTELGALVVEEAPVSGAWGETPLAEIATADLIEGIGGEGVWLKTRRVSDGATRRLRFRMATEGGGLGFALRGVRVAGEGGRIRVAFDREGGFTVERGAETSVTARVVDGGGYGIREWEGNAPGHAEGRRNETWVIDTAEAGKYWLRAIGWCDGTDEDVRGTIRFRVAEPARVARAAGEGESVVWSEDFAGMTSGSSTVIDYNDWTGDKCYNISNSVRVGSSNGGGYVTSTNGTLGGSAGRLEFSMWRHDSGAAAALQQSVDGGTTWLALTNYTSLSSSDSPTTYSVDVPASETVMFKWSNTAGKQRFYLDDVTLYATGGGETPTEPQPPVLDLDPDVEAVTLFEGQAYEIEVTATEYDGDEITLSASGLPDADAWYAEDPATGSVTGEFIWKPETTGTWNVVFSATDKDGTTNRTVAFTVVPEGPGALAFESDGVHVRESAGTVTLTVVRTNGAAGAVTVAWATTDGTAAAGSEYVAGSGSLAFADGQASASFTVSLLDDTAAEDNKSFSVVLGNVTGGAALGDVTTCSVTIVDDDDANASYYASCYKNGVLKTGDDLKDALCRILNTGVKTNTYGSRLDDILQVTDRHSTNGSSSQVRCIYLQSGITSFNKEHIWAQSHGIDESGPAYSDLHHIRACNSTMNSTRGDKDFDNRRNISGATEVNGCWYTSKAWEPPDDAKGDVARAVLYMDVRYENKYNGKVDLETVDSIGTSTDGNQLGKLSTLIAWNELDPPDDFERRRNELIYTTYQYNRNPFIDHPTWVRAVFDPSNFTEEAITWTVNVTVEGAGWVNGNASAFSVDVTNGLTKTFLVQPDAASYCHIGSIAWNGTVVPQAYYTNASYYNYTCPAVSNNSTLAVVFESETAALGTPVWWLAQYGTNSTAVAQQDWNAAELEDWNDDGVPNWQEYQAGNDPTAFALRQVSGVAVSGETEKGFAVSWNAVDYADGYRVRVCETTHVAAATAGFENEELDAGWTVSMRGTTVATNGAMEGTWGLSLSTNGAWLAWGGDVENPASVTFKYKRSGNAAAWALEAQVSTDGGLTWTTAGSVTDAVTMAKSAEIDLSPWHGQTVRVRLVDARAEGNAARYVDDVTIWRGGGTVAEGTTSATTWTATGLSAGTGYDVQVRGEATTLGTAVGPWSEPVRATTLSGTDTRQEQTITFPAIAEQTIGATVTLEATASSGLAVEYAVSGPATLSGTTLTCTAAGTVTVTASQPGNEQWKPAASVTRTFAVTEPVLTAPENVWASATNDTSFTAAWSAVDGATGYELSVWTANGGGDEPGGPETMLWSVDFNNFTGNGNTRLTNAFLSGWTVSNAFIGTNEFRVGASGAGGGVTSAVANVSGSLRVVSRARAWAADSDVILYVTVGEMTQTNALTGENAGFTNVFENVDGEVSVGWGTPAGKKRFFLNQLEVSAITTVASKETGNVPVPGYEARAVSGTSCVVTGLTAATTYEFHARATAGSATGAWSETADVTTLAQGGGEGQEQSITFGAIADQVVGATVTLDATASSGLAVTYSVAGPATLSGTTLTCTGVGTVSVTASQAGNVLWAAAVDVVQSFAVTAAPVELAAPANVWASVTNETAFTAAWSAVAEAERYELTVWTSGGGESVVTPNETVLFSTDFADITGNGNTALTNGFIEGWTVTKAYAATNEVRVGANSALGWVNSATVGATGTVKVVTRARAWSDDATVLWVGVTGCDSQTNTLSNDSAGFTNVFENVKGTVTVCWSNATASKQRFFLEEVSASEISIVEESIAGAELVPGYEVRAVDGTTCVVTGLTAATEYGFKVRAVAGEESSAWSVDAAVTTLAAKQVQTITFEPIGNQVATNTVTLSAMADSGLEVSFEVTSGSGVLDGSMLTFTGAGEVTVMAIQAGNETYAAATASQTFTVAKAAQSIDFPAIAGQSVGDEVTLAATASSGLAVSYAASGPASLEGTVLTCTGAGTVRVTASQTGNDIYEAATPVEHSFEVTKAALTPQEAYETWLNGKVDDPDAPDLAYETAMDDDADEDGVSNWLEYVADTDPTDGDDFLRLKVELQADGTWRAKPEPASTNRGYAIVTRTDLGDDSTLSTNSFPIGSAAPATVIDLSNDGGIWFGRVLVRLGEEE